MPKHKCYVEVFAGGASVFFRKEPSEVEVLNDINRELITLYRVVQNHPGELARYLRYTLVSREEFYRQRNTPPEVLTDIQRAARFYYLQKNAFGGKVVNPSFGVSKAEKSRLNPLKLRENINEIYERIARVLLECLPYDDLIPRYDGKDTLFYVDPPYWGVEDYYGKEIFSREDFTKLAAMLAGVQGKFILSINDVPEIRNTFRKFNIKEVQTTYSVQNGKRSKAYELLITNF